MSMRIATEVSTKVVRENSGSAIPVSEILVNGAEIGRRVSGAVLEAAIQLERFYLLFMTDDTPFEEALSVYLFDTRWNLLDSAVLGGIYSSGSFSALALNEPDSVHFRFIGDTDWCVRILSRRRFRLPFFPDAPGVRRPLGFTRHFIVHGNPRPVTG